MKHPDSQWQHYNQENGCSGHDAFGPLLPFLSLEGLGLFPEDFLQERVFHSEQAVPLFEGGLQDLVDGEEAIMGAQQSV